MLVRCARPRLHSAGFWRSCSNYFIANSIALLYYIKLPVIEAPGSVFTDKSSFVLFGHDSSPPCCHYRRVFFDGDVVFLDWVHDSTVISFSVVLRDRSSACIVSHQWKYTCLLMIGPYICFCTMDPIINWRQEDQIILMSEFLKYIYQCQSLWVENM